MDRPNNHQKCSEHLNIVRNGIRVNFPVFDCLASKYLLENCPEQKFKVESSENFRKVKHLNPFKF